MVCDSGQLRPHSKYDHAFAIVRIDGVDTLASAPDPSSRITVKAVLWDPAEAAAEVARLNALRDDDVVYSSQITRVQRRPSAP